MYRQTISRLVKLLPQGRMTLSTTARVMASGDTGAPRAGGSRADDSFSSREKSNENLGIKIREREKLNELRNKISEQHEHLNRLEEHL
ncbi:putative mitochondrial atpase inhibitor [Golovinomyces cichoracearum]|uniref:ATPase inhibitor, mitochondrial n=1 Tax=Golovinomyces cichoracearum TaxID=62708 RepID=A0A420H1R4_9PEZI|nr:putative mitochondrial atpase inhibitor [Golovinomyces cichoracearum]